MSLMEWYPAKESKDVILCSLMVWLSPKCTEKCRCDVYTYNLNTWEVEATLATIERPHFGNHHQKNPKTSEVTYLEISIIYNIDWNLVWNLNRSPKKLKPMSQSPNTEPINFNVVYHRWERAI
jgi:hypothetical protein